MTTWRPLESRWSAKGTQLSSNGRDSRKPGGARSRVTTAELVQGVQSAGTSSAARSGSKGKMEAPMPGEPSHRSRRSGSAFPVGAIVRIAAKEFLREIGKVEPLPGIGPCRRWRQACKILRFRHGPSASLGSDDSPEEDPKAAQDSPPPGRRSSHFRPGKRHSALRGLGGGLAPHGARQRRRLSAQGDNILPCGGAHMRSASNGADPYLRRPVIRRCRPLREYPRPAPAGRGSPSVSRCWRAAATR